MRLRASDIVGDLVLLGVGLTACGLGVKLDLGTLSAPAAGLLPFLAGLLLAMLSALHIALSLVRSHGSRPAASPERLLRNPRDWFLTLGVIVAMLLVLEHVGFVASTFLFAYVLHWRVGRRGPGSSAIYAGVVAGMSWLVFSYWFRVPLP